MLVVSLSTVLILSALQGKRTVNHDKLASPLLYNSVVTRQLLTFSVSIGEDVLRRQDVSYGEK